MVSKEFSINDCWSPNPLDYSIWDELVKSSEKQQLKSSFSNQLFLKVGPIDCIALMEIIYVNKNNTTSRLKKKSQIGKKISSKY